MFDSWNIGSVRMDMWVRTVHFKVNMHYQMKKKNIKYDGTTQISMKGINIASLQITAKIF